MRPNRAAALDQIAKAGLLALGLLPLVPAERHHRWRDRRHRRYVDNATTSGYSAGE